MKESKIYSRNFDIADAGLAIWFYNKMGNREDVSSCIKYTNLKKGCYTVEWTYKR